MLEPDYKAWSSVIRDCCLSAQHEKAVFFFLQKLRCCAAFKPSSEVFSAVLKSCAALSAVELGKSLHAHLLKLGHLSCLCVSKALLNMYGKSGALDNSWKLFGQINNPDAVVLNILLSGFARSKAYDAETVKMFNQMHLEWKHKISPVTISIILPLCARLGDLDAGKRVHSFIVKSGLDTYTLVGNALVSMYAKCGLVSSDAYTAFTCIPLKDIVSWNAIISGFVENNLIHDGFRIFRWMLKEPIGPNYVTIATILPVCSSLGKDIAYYLGRQIHSYVLQRPEIAADISVCNAVIMFYLRIGCIQEAEMLFRRMEVRDLVSWNSVIAGYASNDLTRALQVFHELVTTEKVILDRVTLACILPVFAQLKRFQQGKQIHGYIIRHCELFEDTTVGNNLVHFYAECNDAEAAFRSFLMISSRDIISWNSMLDAFNGNRSDPQFLDLLQWMLEEGTKPDSVTVIILISFSIAVSQLRLVKEIHGYAIRSGVSLGDTESTIENALLDAYGKCGDMNCALNIFKSSLNKRNLQSENSIILGNVICRSHDGADKVFDWTFEIDLTIWNSIIRVYSENGCLDEALSFFRELHARGLKPNELTIMSLLPICAQGASIHLLRQCHGYVVRTCFEDVKLSVAILDAYAKSGSIEYAYNLFHSSPHKDLVMFTAMIGGFAMHGMGKEALEIFYDMIGSGVKPDQVVITSVLAACSHAGLVNEGLKIFDSIQRTHRMLPTTEQYACLVDLLARGGRVNDAYSFVSQMHIHGNTNLWSALLGACRTHHEVELGRIVADQLFQMKSDDIGNYIVMSNLYAADARWVDVLEMRKKIKTRNLRKPAGCSWIEVDRRKNVFMAGDYSHPERIIIYSTLGTIDQQIKERHRGLLLS